MKHVSLEGRLNGETNMARDWELFQLASNGVHKARIYGWDGAWVSLGKSQTAGRSLLDPAAISHVARPTGGKAVLHGHDVTLGLSMPLDLLGFTGGQSRGTITVYRKVVGILTRALQECGVKAELGEAVGKPGVEGHTADCFAHVAPNDIVDLETGTKVCGCALRLGLDAVLVQASIPAGPPLVDPHVVFARPAAVHWVPLDPRDFAAALDEAIERTVGSLAEVS